MQGDLHFCNVRVCRSIHDEGPLVRNAARRRNLWGGKPCVYRASSDFAALFNSVSCGPANFSRPRDLSPAWAQPGRRARRHAETRVRSGSERSPVNIWASQLTRRDDAPQRRTRIRGFHGRTSRFSGACGDPISARNAHSIWGFDAVRRPPVHGMVILCAGSRPVGVPENVVFEGHSRSHGCLEETRLARHATTSGSHERGGRTRNERGDSRRHAQRPRPQH